jgi:hypothetical protein
MPYDQGLAHRIREMIEEEPGLTEKEMFGGIGFMIGGNMATGVIGDDLMVRVGKEAHEEARAKPHTKEFDFTGRPMKGWVVVLAEGLTEDAELNAWVMQGVDYAKSLPPK